jgi:hypothetical protein
MQVCQFCLGFISSGQSVVNLRLGQAHEKCYLEACRNDFQKMLTEISQFPNARKSFQSAVNGFIALLRNYVSKAPTNEAHKEFCDEWGKCNRAIMEFDMYRWYAQHYLAQKSALDRFISKLKGYPFTAPRTPIENKKYGVLMSRIIAAATNYSISFLPGSVSLRRDKKKGRVKSKEEYVGEMKKLIVEFETLMKNMADKTLEDMRRYGVTLSKDYELWQRQNISKLMAYKLLKG